MKAYRGEPDGEMVPEDFRTKMEPYIPGYTFRTNVGPGGMSKSYSEIEYNALESDTVPNSLSANEIARQYSERSGMKTEDILVKPATLMKGWSIYTRNPIKKAKYKGTEFEELPTDVQERTSPVISAIQSGSVSSVYVSDLSEIEKYDIDQILEGMSGYSEIFVFDRTTQLLTTAYFRALRQNTVIEMFFSHLFDPYQDSASIQSFREIERTLGLEVVEIPLKPKERDKVDVKLYSQPLEEIEERDLHEIFHSSTAPIYMGSRVQGQQL